MGLNKATGNMYEFVSHTWNPLAGACPHACIYCYVDGLMSKPALAAKYSGQPRIHTKELKTNLGAGNFIFVCNMTDLFAAGVHSAIISTVLEHCWKYPENQYLFQTKNPDRMLRYLDKMPPHRMLGTTMETNEDWIQAYSQAPRPRKRAYSMVLLKQKGERTLLTIEPIGQFEIEDFVWWILEMRPDLVAIGAESQRCSVWTDPNPDDVRDLIERIEAADIKVHRKANLGRLLGGSQ